MINVLTLIGDFYHNHDDFFNTLSNVLKDLAEDVKIIDSTTEDFEMFLGQKPDAVIIARENRINPEDSQIKFWMTDEIEKKIEEYVENGGKLFVWHSGLASYPENGSFCSTVRGYFKYHPDKHKPVRYHSYGKSVFNKQIVDLTILDEHYFVYCDERNTNVYLYSESEDGQSIAGWWHDLRNGRVITLTPAHRKEVLLNKDFQNLLRIVIEKLFE